MKIRSLNITLHVIQLTLLSKATFIPVACHILPGQQLRVRCLAEGHLDTGHGAAGAQTRHPLHPCAASPHPDVRIEARRY